MRLDGCIQYDWCYLDWVYVRRTCARVCACTCMNRVILGRLNLIFQCTFTLADWELMAEMNNSVYGNPSSLTIHNERNIKTGECVSSVSCLFSLFTNCIAKCCVSLQFRELRGLTSSNLVFRRNSSAAPAVARGYIRGVSRHLRYTFKESILFDLDLCSHQSFRPFSRSTFEKRRRKRWDREQNLETT